MTQGELEEIQVPIEKVFRDLEIRIMDDIVRRIKINRFSTASADWQITRLQQLGMSEKEIKEWVRIALELSNEEIDRIFSDELYRQYMGHGKAYAINGMKQIPFEKNLQLQALIEAIKRQTKDTFCNMTNSMGFVKENFSGQIQGITLSEYYKRTLDAAIMDIHSGAFSYQAVLKRTIEDMTKSGIRWIDYKTKIHNRIDVAARRAVMTGFRQIQGKINEQVALELGTDSYEVTYHTGARPSHQSWQGKVWTMQQLMSVCGLGSVTGLHGANCYHDYNAFIPGVSVRTYTDEELERMIKDENTPKTYNGKEYTAYEALQQQRRMETAMRKTRRDIKLLQSGDADKDAVIAKQARYQLQMQQYKAFSKAMKLPEQMERVYHDGLGRIVTGKATEKEIREAKYRLSSSKSYKRSLEYVRNGKAGLTKARKAMLDKVPDINSWVSVEKGKLSTKDIAFLSAYTKHEFAIWESKHDTILCHGSRYHCDLPDEIYDLLLSGKYKLIAHTHVDMGILSASADDRNLLKIIGQKKSLLLSIDGREVIFSQNMFDSD